MKRAVFHFICILALSSQAFGSDLESRIQAMEETLKKQQKTIEEQQKVIEELKDQIRTQVAAEKEKVAVTEPETQKPAGLTGLFGSSVMSNPNISLVLNAYDYSSNLTTDELKNRGIPGYTTEGIDRRNGFNLDSAELGIYAPVDPYFNLYATIPITEDGVSIEEAYFVTT
ncbi:MAG TPA: type I restriction-modification enzyme R subunit C-terminal domain-containing protein [Syntrophales bacterium]|nr:type I restriction-modification enzyme R subunit C-terminal domain-containing protein [Syntrophales bacterium]